ncbi:hypothetical protein ELI_06770 [Erythrobacter litoralis HTCC2594]|uniref:NAD-specific glutamate dehydrogenase n=1 Tax=Erythrobacter litoralis (strain HTCC2594) TaxID=314225 RepID=Q2NA45_ERYLH|nr:hypothetical protein ELI_06770 [Erythrobacter litoralis HTCC2594]
MRAIAGGRFQNPGTQALAAHFHQAEAGDAADLDARPIVLERVLHRALDLPDIGIVFHVDEVDHDEPGHVAQAQLTGDFLGRFDIGRCRGLLDPVLLGGTARVDVDRNKCLGRVDDQVAARFELHDRIVHGAQLVLRTVALEQRHRVGIGFHPPRMARHQQLHEALGELVAFLALDHDFLDLAIVDIADRALDEVAVRMDQARRARRQRLLADLVPKTREVVEVALDFRLGAAEAGGADDQAHLLGQAQVGDDLLQPLAIAGARNLAADPAAVRRIGHKDGVATGKAEIGRQRRALVAALFLDDLHQHHLAALDNVLDLVPATQRLALGANCIDFLGPGLATATLPFALVPTAATTTSAASPGLAVVAVIVVVIVVVGIVIVRIVVVIIVAVELAFLDRRNLVLLGRVDFLQAVFGQIFGERSGAFVLGVVFVARHFAAIFFLGAQTRLFLGGFGLFREQLLAVRLRDLVIVGMDFAKGEETVTVASEIYERRLQRRFDPRDFGQVDIAFDLLVFSRLEIEFLNPVAFEHRHPGFFRVARIDKHARCHVIFSVRRAVSPGS